MGSTISDTNTFRVHQDFPFARVGASIDFLAEKGAPDSELLLVNEWWIELNGNIQPQTFKSAELALAAVPALLFAPRNADFVQEQLKRAKDNKEIDLVTALSFGAGRALGRAEACADLTHAMGSAISRCASSG